VSILILHTSNASRRKHFATASEYAREHGERLLLIVANPTWETEFADRVVTADTSDIDLTVQAAKDLAASETEPVRGVVAFVEHSVPAAAAVAASFGLPFVRPETAYRARDKFSMRTAFASAGMPQPEFGLARTESEALSAAARIGYPVVLKPLIGGGSMYVRRVNNDTELAEHFEMIRRGAWDGFDYDPLHRAAQRAHGAALLVEKYVPGGEISVESLVIDGQSHVIAVHDKPLPMDGPYFEEVYYATPSQLPQSLLRRITELTGAAHKALGITTGATHTEFRVRPDRDPLILETAARLGGGPVYRSVLLSTGVDMVRAVLDLSLGRRPSIQVAEPPVPIGFYLFFAERAGTVRAIHGVDEAAADPCVHEIDLYRKVGDRVNVPPHVWQAHGHVIFTADRRDRLDDMFASLKSIQLEVE
jgi:biotin carboxylase